MALIIDPDDLNQATEIDITTGTRKITLNIAGNLSAVEDVYLSIHKI